MGYKVDMSGVAKKLDSICQNTRVGKFGASELRRDMERRVPRLDGHLRASAVVSPFTVTYNMPYARKQWTGRGIRNYTTPGTGSHWEKGVNKAELGIALTQYIRGL